jgi:hypothetical protein
LGGIVVLVARTGKYIIVAATLSAFGGCQAVGPIAIDVGRDRYNNIIQSTSKQQAFANIIRVHNNEPTSFVDVTEVDASQTFTGTVSGSVTGIGARAGTSGGTLAGQVGSVTPGVSYSENPIIRYVPLVGQGLVEQTVAPVNTDALASLHDSGWPVMPLVDLAMPVLTLDHDDVGAAVNLIAELDFDGRLQLASTKSDWTKKPNDTADGSSGTGNTSQQKKSTTSASTNDALVIYFLTSGSDKRDQQLWKRLMGLYQGTQLAPCKATDPLLNKKPQGCMLDTARFIELRTAPVTTNPCKSADPPTDDKPQAKDAKSQECKPPSMRTFTYTAPLMRTFSALGILKSAAQQPNPRIAFISPGDYERITHYWWNDPDQRDTLLCVYTVTPGDLRPGDEEFSHTASAAHRDRHDDRRADQQLDQWLKAKFTEQQASGNGRLSLPYVVWWPDISEYEFGNLNGRLWELRRYMLIIQSDAPPPANAYVAYFDRGLWYYIDGADRISQKNFNLISLFLTVMAIPPTNAPLTTSISIGGG